MGTWVSHVGTERAYVDQAGAVEIEKGSQLVVDDLTNLDASLLFQLHLQVLNCDLRLVGFQLDGTHESLNVLIGLQFLHN